MTPEMIQKMKMLKEKMGAMKDSNPDQYANIQPHEAYLDQMMGSCSSGSCGGGDQQDQGGTDLTIVVGAEGDHGGDQGPLMAKFDEAVAMLAKPEQKMITDMKDTWGKLSPEGQKVAMLLWKIYAMGPEKNADLNKRMMDYQSSMGA